MFMIYCIGVLIFFLVFLVVIGRAAAEVAREDNNLNNYDEMDRTMTYIHTSLWAITLSIVAAAIWPFAILCGAVVLYVRRLAESLDKMDEEE